MPLKFRWFTRWSWFWVSAGLLLGGIIHISTIIALPYVSSNSAWERLRINTPANTMQILPPTRPDYQVLPLLAPDVRYGLCRYDVTKGPVVVRAQLLEPTWSVALYTPVSLNFYAITGADIKRNDLVMVLTTAKEGEAASLPLLKGSGALTVAVPGGKGILLLRAPLRSSAYLPATRAALAQASCRPARQLKKATATQQ